MTESDWRKDLARAYLYADFNAVKEVVSTLLIEAEKRAFAEAERKFYWEEADRIELIGSFGGRVFMENGAYRVALGYTNVPMKIFKTKAEADEWLANALKKSGYSPADDPVIEAERRGIERAAKYLDEECGLFRHARDIRAFPVPEKSKGDDQ